MKKIILLALCLCSAVAFAQMPEVDYPCAKLIENGDYEKAEKKIVKDYQRDSNDVFVCYAYYRLLSEKYYTKHNYVGAYALIIRADRLFKKMDEKTQNKLLKNNITQERLLYDIREASEQWLQNAINSNNIKSLETYLTQCTSATERQKQAAIKKRNTLEFNAAKAINTVDAYQSFIDMRAEAEEVESAIQLRDSIAYADAARTNTINAYQNFISNYPNAKEVSEAQSNIHRIAYAQAEVTNTIDAYQSFISIYPTAKEVTSAKNKIHKMEYDKAVAANTIDAYQLFINNYPTAAEVDEAKKKIKELEKESGCVTLVVSADGATKTEAINNALRAAIEQTYGTFVSSDTWILYDELVRDEIVTISSGNIQRYREITAISLPDGNTSVTLEATVSITKLIKFAQSKGSECEFAGATFGANLRMYEFYKKNEKTAIQNMISQLNALRPAYDYEIVVSDPVMSGDSSAKVKIDVKAIENERTKTFNDIIRNTFMALAMTSEQVKPLQDVGFDFNKYLLYITDNGEVSINGFYWFYNPIPKEIGYYVLDAMFDFSIIDNNSNSYAVDILVSNYDENPNCFGYVIGAPAPYEWGDGYCTITGHQYFNRTEHENVMMLFCNQKVQGYLNDLSFYIPVEFLTKIHKIKVIPSPKTFNKVSLQCFNDDECPKLSPYLLHSEFTNSTWDWNPLTIKKYPAKVTSEFLAIDERVGRYQIKYAPKWKGQNEFITIENSKRWSAVRYDPLCNVYYNGYINSKKQLIIEKKIIVWLRDPEDEYEEVQLDETNRIGDIDCSENGKVFGFIDGFIIRNPTENYFIYSKE